MPQSLVVKDTSGATQTILYPIPGTAGTPSSDVASVQGVSGGVPIPVVTQLAPPKAGQKKLTVGGTAVPLASNIALVNGVVITASLTNVATIFVGDATVNTTNDGTGSGYPLAPGQSISYATTNANLVYINSVNNTDFVSYAGN